MSSFLQSLSRDRPIKCVIKLQMQRGNLRHLLRPLVADQPLRNPFATETGAWFFLQLQSRRVSQFGVINFMSLTFYDFSHLAHVQVDDVTHTHTHAHKSRLTIKCPRAHTHSCQFVPRILYFMRAFAHFMSACTASSPFVWLVCVCVQRSRPSTRNRWAEILRSLSL